MIYLIKINTLLLSNIYGILLEIIDKFSFEKLHLIDRSEQ